MKLLNLNRTEQTNVQLPILRFQNLPITERQSEPNYSELYKNIFQSVNVKDSKIKTFEKENTLTKKESKIIKKPRMITKFHRKQTMNFDLNFNTNLISKKLLKKCKLNVKNNRFLKKLKGQIKDMEKKKIERSQF